MATFIKRPSGWLAQVRLKGAEPQFQTFPTKAQAVIWAGEVEAEIRARKSPKFTGSDKTMHDALVRYKNEVSKTKAGARWEEIRIDKFIRELPFIGKLIGDVDVTDISEWRDSIMKINAASTANREMNVLSAVFTVAVQEWQWCKHNPVRDVKRPKNPKHRERLTSPKETELMLESFKYVEGVTPVTVGQRVAVAYLIALETAMRAGEICALRRQDIHLGQRYVTLYGTKNGDNRNVPLSTRAAELLALVPDGLGLLPSQIDSHWRKHRDMVGIKDLTFHDSRHQAITNLAQKLGMLDLAKMVGHRNPKNLMIYYNETASSIAKRLD